MDAEFQIRKVKPAVKKMRLPCFFRSVFEILSNAINSGTNAISNNGVVKGIGGQASQSKKALNKARRLVCVLAMAVLMGKEDMQNWSQAAE